MAQSKEMRRELNRLRMRAWREEHQEEARARNRAWYEANKERESAKRLEKYYLDHEASLARRRAYYAANLDKMRQDRREKYWKDPKGAREAMRRWRRNNPERDQFFVMRWRKNNPEKVALYTKATGAKRRKAPLDLNAKIYANAIASDPCVYCGETNKPSLEHITPIARGGDSQWSNLAIACLRCNKKKQTKLLSEFLLAGGMRSAA